MQKKNRCTARLVASLIILILITITMLSENVLIGQHEHIRSSQRKVLKSGEEEIPPIQDYSIKRLCSVVVLGRLRLPHQHEEEKVHFFLFFCDTSKKRKKYTARRGEKELISSLLVGLFRRGYVASVCNYLSSVDRLSVIPF